MAGPVFLPQAAPVYPANADVTKQLGLLGDTISGGIRNYQRARLLQDALKPGPGGNVDYEKSAIGLIAAGEPQAGAAIASIGNAKANREFRMSEAERSQRNADRSFGLQQQQFSFNKKMKEQELGIKRLESAYLRQGGYKSPKEKAEVEGGLRKEFTATTKDFREARDAYGRVVASAKNPSAAGDLALIFNYMKVLDPGSVVRESEFATAAASGSYGERIKAAVSKIMSGQRLSDEMRNDFTSRAKLLFESQNKQYAKTKKQFEGIGSRLNLDLSNVAPDYSIAQQDQTGAQTPPEAANGVVDYRTYFGGQ